MKVLTVDEIGYLPISRLGAMLFFRLKPDDAALRACVDGSGVQQGLRGVGEIFGDEVMAAALIDRLVHHCHLVTGRGNSYRMRQHADLWQTLHAPADRAPASRRRRRQEVTTN